MTEAALEAVPESSPSPLVYVSFKKNEQRKFKFLEGEPKALGITQMCTSIFHISCVGLFFGTDLIRSGLEIPVFISSLLVFTAGSLAIAAKKLHQSLLKACLGMELVASLASLYNLINSLAQMSDFFSWRISDYCYAYDPSNFTDAQKQHRQNCNNFEAATTHLFAEFVILHVTLLAVSVTLVIYAAKVVNCCTPPPKQPVIAIQAPPATQ